MSEDERRELTLSKREQLQTESFLEVRKFWARKWYDYLTIGNGGALLASASALLQTPANAKILASSAWWFFGGLLAGGALPKIRFHRISVTARLVLHQHHRPTLFGQLSAKPFPPSWRWGVGKLLDFGAALLEAASVTAFCVGVIGVLKRVT